MSGCVFWKITEQKIFKAPRNLYAELFILHLGAGPGDLCGSLPIKNILWNQWVSQLLPI